MSKKAPAGEPASHANLWGKPLPRIPARSGAETTSATGTGTRPAESDSDVDAELDEDEDGETELESEESEDEGEGTVLDTSEDSDADDADDDADDGDDDEVASAVEVDKSAPRARKARDNTKVEEMAEKKSLSDYVREEIADRKASGESLRGVDIMNALAKRKIKVSAAQVSQLLKKEGVSSKARGGRKPAAATAAASDERSRVANKARTATRPTSGTDLPWDRLNAAKTFVSACGGSVEEAEDVLSMFQKLNKVVST